MVMANNLINGTTIYQDNECKNVEYYHLECKYHSAIYANGILAETYLDTANNRNIFENSIKSIPLYLSRSSNFKIKLLY